MKVKTTNSILVSFLAIALSIGMAHGAIFGDMGDSGQFSREDLGVTLVDGSYWSAYVTSNAQATMVSDGGTAPSNYVNLAIQWYPREASFWYVDASLSNPDEIWTVSADVSAATGRDPGDRYMSIGSSSGTGTFNPWDFRINLKYLRNTIEWVAGSQSGSVVLDTMPTTWTTVEINYNASTGEAVGTFGGVTVFNTVIETGIRVNAVHFSRYNNSYTYDAGSFSVDNVTAAGIVPAPSVAFTVPGISNGQVLTNDNGLDSMQVIFTEDMVFTTSDVEVYDGSSTIVAATVTGSGTSIMDIQFAQPLLYDSYAVTIKDTVVSLADSIALDGNDDLLAGGDATFILEHRRRTDLNNDNAVDIEDLAILASDWCN